MSIPFPHRGRKPTRAKRNAFRPGVESCEARRLMAANLAASLTPSGQLYVEGTDVRDVIVIRQTGSTITVDGLSASFNLANVTSVTVNGLGGDDFIELSATSTHQIGVIANIAGGAGNDVIEGGGKNDVIDGGTGDDTLWGNAGNDVLLGGDGDDRVYGDAGNDYLYGNAGNDYIDGGLGDDNLYAGTGYDRLLGGDGSDLLSGTEEPDTVADLFLGGPGNDLLRGGNGNDYLAGEDGDDTLYGNAGDDRLYGGEGNDLIDGGDGGDNLYAGHGYDRLLGGVGDDLLTREEADDTVGDLLMGGAGNDLIYGSLGADYIAGEDGDDRLYGNAGSDYLYGNAGNDYIDGGLGDDNLYAGTGYDRLLGGDGSDLLSGTEEPDTVADLFLGGPGNDLLRGGNGNDYLAGEDGDDTLYGNAGDDRLYGGEGNDLIDGGDGGDNLYGEGGNDHLDGGAGNDRLEGGIGVDALVLSNGNDVASWVTTSGQTVVVSDPVILRTYVQLGGEGGAYGEPIGNVVDYSSVRPGWWGQEFQGGAIYTDGITTIPLCGTAWTKYKELGGGPPSLATDASGQLVAMDVNHNLWRLDAAGAWQLVGPLYNLANCHVQLVTVQNQGMMLEDPTVMADFVAKVIQTIYGNPSSVGSELYVDNQGDIYYYSAANDGGFRRIDTSALWIMLASMSLDCMGTGSAMDHLPEFDPASISKIQVIAPPGTVLIDLGH